MPLEFVHYYEDGFEFGRRSLSFTADARHNDSLWSWWLAVGQSSDVRWAPGEYRLHVYNEGRKLVDLGYVVTEQARQADSSRLSVRRIFTSSNRAGPIAALDGLYRSSGIQRRICGVKM